VKILFATSEIAPWVKTGGLGDVAAALPPALRRAGGDVRILVPAYPALRKAFPDAAPLAHLPSPGGTLPAADLLGATHDGHDFLLLDCPDLYDRPGNPYLGPEGHDWLDNHRRFGLLSRVAARLSGEATPLDWRPDILHCHDWQTGLAPYYLRFHEHGNRAKSVLTIHNLAFQGIFPPGVLDELTLFASDWHMDGVEYFGQVSFLKAGLGHADALTTVSPAYAREIQTEAEGMGMQGLLRARADRLSGILNGIDTDLWNPASDPHLAARYDRDHLDAKAADKTALQRELGLEQRPDVPLFGIVSRLTRQKGLDLVAEIGDRLACLPAQLAVLGSGEKLLEVAYRGLAAQYPGQVAVTIGFDEALAHRIEAGVDIFLMPSRFEPCGLNQMYSLAYGTLPLVRATGGLADTVIDAGDAQRGNGFVCAEATPGAIFDTARRAVAAWQDTPRWRQLQRNAMAGDFGWEGPARRYCELYAGLLNA
jgi:starch synthase